MMMQRFYSEVSLFVTFLARGRNTKLVGRPTASPIAHPPRNLCRNPGSHPVVMVVIVNVIVESRASVMKIAINNVEYLGFTFKVVSHMCCLYRKYVLLLKILLNWHSGIAAKRDRWDPVERVCGYENSFLDFERKTMLRRERTKTVP